MRVFGFWLVALGWVASSGHGLLLLPWTRPPRGSAVAPLQMAIRNLRPLTPSPPGGAVGAGPDSDVEEEVVDEAEQARRQSELVASLERKRHQQQLPLQQQQLQQQQQQSQLMAPNLDDMKRMAFLLANVSDVLDTNPEVALSLASQNMGWLFARDVPGLTQLLLKEYPALRQDSGMMRGYMFLVDFLEAIGRETSNLLKKNQAAMKTLLEAMKVSEAAVDEVIEHSAVLKSPEFLVYLDSEIQSQERNGRMENLLVTIKLRLLEELGKDLGYDTTILPKLAAEEDPAELRRRTLEHLQTYEGVGGKELFLHALRLMKKEMKKSHTKVNPLLVANLGEVEKIAQGLIDRERAAEEEA